MAEIALEVIGDDMLSILRQFGATQRELSPLRPGVAECIGLTADDTPQLRWLQGRKDYSRANSVGSRGVNMWYALAEGHYYFVRKRVSWKRSRTYYVTVVDGDIVEVSERELVECLSAD